MGTLHRLGLTALLLTAATGTLTLAATGPAAAADCATISDQAQVLGTSHAQLDAALSAAQSAGLDPKVLTLPTLTGSIDDTVNADITACPTWLGTDGKAKANLVVLAVAPTAHKTALHYGFAYAPALDSQYRQLQTRWMNPYFAHQDWADGLTQGLTHTQQAITADATSSSGSAASTPSPAGSAADPGRDSGATLRGLANLALIVLTVLAGLALGAGLVLAGRHLTTTRRQRRAALAGARRIACQTQAAAQEAFLALDGTINELRQQLASVKTAVSDEDDADVDRTWDATRAAAEAAFTAWTSAADTYPADPLPAADLATAEAAIGAYQKAADELAAARAAAATTSDTMRALLTDLAALRDLAAQATDAVHTAQAGLDGAAAAGWTTTEAAAALAEARGYLGQLSDLVTARRVRAALALADDITRAAHTVTSDVSAWAGRRQEATSAISGLRGEGEDLLAGHEARLRALASMADTYPAEYLTRAEAARTIPERVRAIQDALGRAEQQLATPDPASLATAEDAIGQARTQLRAAKRDANAVIDTETRLAHARADLPGQLAAAEQAISAAADYISAHTSDVDPARADDVTGLRTKLGKARSGATAGKAPVVELGEAAIRVAKDAAAVLTQARADVTAAEHTRAAAKKAVAAAEAKLEAARTAARRVSTSTASTHLSTAQAALDQARASADLALMITLAEQATRDAEQAQRAAEAAYADSYQSTSSGGSSSYTSSDSGYYGGSTSFDSGSSSVSDGGSTSW